MAAEWYGSSGIQRRCEEHGLSGKTLKNILLASADKWPPMQALGKYCWPTTNTKQMAFKRRAPLLCINCMQLPQYANGVALLCCVECHIGLQYCNFGIRKPNPINWNAWANKYIMNHGGNSVRTTRRCCLTSSRLKFVTWAQYLALGRGNSNDDLIAESNCNVTLRTW